MKAIDHTGKIPKGTVIRLYRKGFGYSRVTLFENTEYYLAVKADEEFARTADIGAPLEAYLWMEHEASYEFSTMVIGRIERGPSILFLQHADSVRRSAGRKCLTAVTDLPARIFAFDPDRNQRLVSSEQIVRHRGRVILLSDREAAIKTEEPVSEGRFVKGHMEIEGHAVELVGTIEVIHPQKNVYNVVFMGMPDKDRHAILDYVYKVYRE